MFIIRLFCAGGFSTGILVKRMEASAEERKIDADIKAYPESFMERCFKSEHVDIALFGPQIAYTMPTIEKICNEYRVPFQVIPSLDYGRLNGDKVLDLALEIINNNR